MMDCCTYLRLSLTALVLAIWLDWSNGQAVEALVCAYTKPGVDTSVRSATYSTLSTQSEGAVDSGYGSERCLNDVNFCYTLWQYNPIDPMNASLYTILAKGCWDASPDVDCKAGECSSYRTPTRALNNTQFCCCSGHLCNANISVAGLPIGLAPQSGVTDGHTSGSSLKFKSFDTSDESSTSVDRGLLVGCLAALLCLAFIGSGLLVCCRALSSSVIESKPRHKHIDSLHLLESNSSSSQSSSLLCEFDKMKLIEEIGRGRYGSVWKAELNEQTVAVKKFGQQYKHYFLNEKDIYLLPLMDMNRCLPRLLGFQEVVLSDGRIEYHLVLSYAPLGSLQDYLRHNTLDWLTLCRLIQTTTKGLAYLHNEVKRGDARKPCVAHRDLSSRNILVNSDLSCMVCDFQFAIRISGSEYYSCGERFDSQTASLNDVGTLRYMAPEILEGAVNLRDCESAMKQIDVYALGLVLWETASRCSDLYQGIEVPPYKQPFEHEIGLNPSFEQMQVLVNKNKARPLFPDIWKDSNPAIRSLKETIEDMWDHDAEARLTALCVEERLSELPLLWERHKSGTLTNVANIYSMVGAAHSAKTLANINNQINRLKSANNSYYNLLGGADATDKLSHDLHNNRFINRLEYPNNNNLTDSLSSYSPSNDFEKNIVSAGNAFVCQPKLTLPLQPHQGRNPCLERNLMTESSEDKPSVFLEHGFKFQTKQPNRDSLLADVYNESTNNESNSLMANDVLNRSANETTRNVSRRPGNGQTPITIVQNAVGATTIPKRPNVTRNVNSPSIKKTNEIKSQNNSESNLSKILKKVQLKSLKDWALRRGNVNKESSVEESEPFTRNKANNVEDRRPRADSNSLISGIEATLLEVTPVTASTEPKVTEGSSLTTVIHKSDNRISHDFDVLVDKSMGRPSNLNRIHGLEDNSYISPTTDSFVCKQT